MRYEWDIIFEEWNEIWDMRYEWDIIFEEWNEIRDMNELLYLRSGMRYEI